MRQCKAATTGPMSYCQSCRRTVTSSRFAEAESDTNKNKSAGFDVVDGGLGKDGGSGKKDMWKESAPQIAS